MDYATCNPHRHIADKRKRKRFEQREAVIAADPESREKGLDHLHLVSWRRRTKCHQRGCFVAPFFSCIVRSHLCIASDHDVKVHEHEPCKRLSAIIHHTSSSIIFIHLIAIDGLYARMHRTVGIMRLLLMRDVCRLANPYSVAEGARQKHIV